MTERSQLRNLGISAGVEGDLVIIQTDRTFMSLTPREVEKFHEHLKAAYHGAQRAAKVKFANGQVIS